MNTAILLFSLVATGGTPSSLDAALSDIAAGDRPCTQLPATFAEGPGTEGWLFVTLKRGTLRVRRTRPMEAATITEMVLPEAECRKFALLAYSGGLRAEGTARQYGEAGETRPRIGVGVVGAGQLSVTQWHRQMTPVFAQARALFERLAAHAESVHSAAQSR